MTTEQRLAALEAEARDLRLRDQRREVEHKHMLEAHFRGAGDREMAQKEADETYRLLACYADKRTAEITQRAGQGVPLTIEDVKMIVTTITFLVNRERQMRADIDALGRVVETSATETLKLANELIEGIDR